MKHHNINSPNSVLNHYKLNVHSLFWVYSDKKSHVRCKLSLIVVLINVNSQSLSCNDTFSQQLVPHFNTDLQCEFQSWGEKRSSSSSFKCGQMKSSWAAVMKPSTESAMVEPHRDSTERERIWQKGFLPVNSVKHVWIEMDWKSKHRHSLSLDI